MEKGHEITEEKVMQKKKPFKFAMNKRKGRLVPCYTIRPDGSKQKFTSSPSSNKVFKFLLPLLIALVAIKCQAKGEDPFEAHPIIMPCFCIAICIYGIAMGIRNQVPTHDSQISNYVILVSGTLSSVLLLLIIFPRLPELLISIVPTFLPIILARNKLKQGCYWLYNRVTNVVTHILDWFTRRNATEQPNLPV